MAGNRSFLEGKAGCSRIAVFHTGIGPDAAAAAMKAAIALGPWNLVIAAGFAGGLEPGLALGDAVLDDFQTSNRLVSQAKPIESVQAKAKLRAQTGAIAVDMETDTIRKACLIAGIPIVATRVISDTASQDLPIPFPIWFDLENQRPRPFALLAYLACNPRRIAPFARFVRSIPRLSNALAIAVEGCIGFE